MSAIVHKLIENARRAELAHYSAYVNDIEARAVAAASAKHEAHVATFAADRALLNEKAWRDYLAYSSQLMSVIAKPVGTSHADQKIRVNHMIQMIDMWDQYTATTQEEESKHKVWINGDLEEKLNWEREQVLDLVRRENDRHHRVLAELENADHWCAVVAL